jgi:hypothetical protein
MCLLLSCGGSGADNPNDRISVSVAPASAPVCAGYQTVFAATVNGDHGLGVTWKVLEGDAGGTITNSGLYTAPAALGSYHLVASSVENPGKTVQAVAIVIPPPQIDLFSATPDTILPGQSSILKVAFSGGTGTILPGIGAVANGQQISVSPGASTDYILTVTNPTTGSITTATVTVAVSP